MAEDKDELEEVNTENHSDSHKEDDYHAGEYLYLQQLYAEGV